MLPGFRRPPSQSLHRQRTKTDGTSITGEEKRAAEVIELLRGEYPDVKCALIYEKPHELLIATRLSAQCTDKRVNMVTPALFERFPSIDAFAEAEVGEVEEYIRTCGLYKTKAQDIVNMCVMLRDIYGGKVPDSIEELTKLRE